MTINRDKIRADLLKFQTDCHLNDLNVTIPDPRKIQTKLIECYDYQRKTSIYYNQIRPVITAMKNQLEIEKFNLNVKRRDILTNVDKVKDMPSAKERELATEALLEVENKILLELQNQINVYEDLFDAANMTLKQLKSAEQDVKLLIRVMENQLDKLNVGTVDDTEIKGLTQNLSDLDKMANLSDEIGLDDDVESSEDHLQIEEAVMLSPFGSNDNIALVDAEDEGNSEQLVEDGVAAKGAPKDDIALGEGANQTGIIENVSQDFNGGVPKSTQSEAVVPTEDGSDVDLTELFLGEDNSEENESEEESLTEKTESNPVDDIADVFGVETKEVVKKEDKQKPSDNKIKQVVVNDLDIDLGSLTGTKKEVPKSVDTSDKKVESKKSVIEDDASISSIDLDIDQLLNME
jgi:hypothetical protein